MTMRILGIDPGLRTTGFGVVDLDAKGVHYVASGTISTQHLVSKALPARLKVLFDGIGEVIARYQPTCASIEIVFVNVNPQSTLLLGQARGALVTALVHADLEVAEYTALQMKQAVTGHGRADKTQIQEMVRRLLALPGLPGPDAADALGLAITHAHAGKAMARLAQADGIGGHGSGKYKRGEAAERTPATAISNYHALASWANPLGALRSSSKVTISQHSRWATKARNNWLLSACPERWAR
jgi:crossover junction endodeoxyribonuclease RuvC